MDAIIFSSWIKTDSRIHIGEEYLELFKQNFSDCDIFIGINPKSVPLWYEKLEDAKRDGLSITYGDVSPELNTGSDASGLQKALFLMKNSGNKYNTVWLGHNKGANRDDQVGINHRKMFKDMFWNKREEITKLLHSKNNYGTFGPIMSISTTPEHANMLDKFYKFPYKCLGFIYLYTFYCLKGNIVYDFIQNCSEDFFTKNLCNRWFFENTFMDISSKMGYEPIYGELASHPSNNIVTKGRVDNAIKQWKIENGIL